MFESIVGGNQRAPRRLGSGAILSFVLHAGALALAVWLPSRELGRQNSRGVEVTFFAAPKPAATATAAGVGEPAPAPLPAPETPEPVVARPKTEPRVSARKPKITPEKHEPKPVQTPTLTPTPTLPDPSTQKEPIAGRTAGGGAEKGTGDAKIGGELSGQKAGTGNGPQVGTSTGTGVGAHHYEVLPFGPGMTRPQLISGSTVIYTREALLAQVEGTALAQCVVTVQGTLQNCRIVKGLPHLNDAILAALKTRRYTPITYQGHLVASTCIITMKVSPPSHH